jgi:Flp pilus assembly protein TadG
MRSRTATRDMGAASVELAVLTPLLVALLLLVVPCGRLVSVQLDVDAAAHGAARAASIARTVGVASADAQRVAADTLAARSALCPRPAVAVDSGGLRPAGVVSVTVTCVVPLSDLALLRLPGSHTVASTASSPVDRWRAGPSR